MTLRHCSAGMVTEFRLLIGISLSVHIITGNKKKDEPLELDFCHTGKTGETPVFLMGVSALGTSPDGLMHAGKAKRYTGGTADRGTTSPSGKAGEHTGKKLPEELHEHPLMTPASL